MKKTDILIIGGGPAGMVAASTSRQYYGSKKITVVKSNEKSLVPCGIPYIFGPLLDGVEDDISPGGGRIVKMGIDLLIDTVEFIDFDSKTAECAATGLIQYEKLIIATGSLP
jgi:NADPH-dependent 2,4-dienoyl-CoA reductase/sulfur reductase-like enzyme